MSTSPVKDGHKIVANGSNTAVAKVEEGFAVIFDVLIPLGKAQLYGLMDRDTFHYPPVQLGTGHGLGMAQDVIVGPDLPDRDLMQG